jgi:hypothetical protein
MTSCCEDEADAKAGAVYAYAVSSDPYIIQSEQARLKKEAARVTLPRGCTTAGQRTTCTVSGIPLPTKIFHEGTIPPASNPTEHPSVAAGRGFRRRNQPTSSTRPAKTIYTQVPLTTGAVAVIVSGNGTHELHLS